MTAPWYKKCTNPKKRQKITITEQQLTKKRAMTAPLPDCIRNPPYKIKPLFRENTLDTISTLCQPSNMAAMVLHEKLGKSDTMKNLIEWACRDADRATVYLALVTMIAGVIGVTLVNMGVL